MPVLIRAVPLLMALSAVAQTPPDAEQTLTLGQVTITAYNPVTVTGFENSTNLYFTIRNQSSQNVTVKLTSWQEMQASLPDWVIHFFKFDPGSDSPGATTDFAVKAGESRTFNVYISDDLNSRPKQMTQLPFRFRVLETGDQGTLTVTYVADDAVTIAWNFGDHAIHPSATAAFAGRVTDGDGKAIAGAEVTLALLNDKFTSRVFTGSDGSYRLDCYSLADVQTILGPRPFPYRSIEYFMTAEADGYALVYRPGLRPPAGQTTTLNITMSAAPGVRSDPPFGQSATPAPPRYKQVGSIATDGVLSYWQLRFAGPNRDRVVAVQGQHPPVPLNTPGHMIGIDLAGQELWRVNTADECWGFHVSPDGSLAAAGCRDQHLYIVSTADGRLLQKIKIGSRPGTGDVGAVRFSPDGKYVIVDGAGSRDGFSIVDVATGAATRISGDTFLYNGRFSSDGKRIAGGSSGFVGVFTPDGTELWRAYMGESPLYLEMDARYNVYAAGKSRQLFAWDKDGKLRWSYRTSSTPNEASNGITSDGSFLVAPNMNGLLEAFNSQGGLLWQRFVPHLYPTPGEGPSCGFGTGHNALAMSSAGDLVAIGSKCYEVLVYDRAGTLLWRQKDGYRSDFKGPDPIANGNYPGTNTIDITPDGKYIAAGYADSVIRIFQRDEAAENAPRILSINVAGGGSDVAQNTWIEIWGTDLAPSGVPTGGITWSDAPEFALGRMPTQLGGVSVRVNGKPAYVFYVSANQINVLTPLDSVTGPVPVQVSFGSASAAFPVIYKAVAPSYLRTGASRYVLGLHADYTLIGPASMSVPGYTFTPVRPGETIMLYAVGLGLPATALVEGSSTQSGELLVKPSIAIDGVPASVGFAGVVSPGLYQINVTVPVSARNGDSTIDLGFTPPIPAIDAIIPIQQ